MLGCHHCVRQQSSLCANCQENEPVDEVSNKTTSSQSTDDSKRERCCRQTETDTTNENDSLEALSQDSDERQHEHCIFFCPALESSRGRACGGGLLGLQSLSELDSPFVLQLRHSKERCAHDGDDQARDYAEGSLPDVLGGSEMILAESVEGSDHTASNDETDGQAKTDAPPHLSNVSMKVGAEGSHSDIPA